MLVPFRQMWCLSEPNIDGFFLSSLILQIGKFKNPPTFLLEKIGEVAFIIKS